MTSSVKDEKTNEKFGGDSKMTSNCSDPLLSQQIKPQKLSLSSQDESRSNALSGSSSHLLYLSNLLTTFVQKPTYLWTAGQQATR